MREVALSTVGVSIHYEVHGQDTSALVLSTAGVAITATCTIRSIPLRSTTPWSQSIWQKTATLA